MAGWYEGAWLRARFWRVIRRDGVSVADAAQAVGVSFGTGRRWFDQAGGVMPADPRPAPAAYRRLSFEEREQIALGLAAGDSARAIARRLGRPPSTVTREIARNQNTHRRPAYRASAAQRRAAGRARRPKPAKLATNLVLRAEVQQRLEHNPKHRRLASQCCNKRFRSNHRRCHIRTSEELVQLDVAHHDRSHPTHRSRQPRFLGSSSSSHESDHQSYLQPYGELVHRHRSNHRRRPS